MAAYGTFIELLSNNVERLSTLVNTITSDPQNYPQGDHTKSVETLLTQYNPRELDFLHTSVTQIDRNVARAFILNVQTMKGHLRKNGQIPYAVHPTRLAYYFLPYSTSVPSEIAERAIILSNIHDIIEELVKLRAKGMHNHPWLGDLHPPSSVEPSIEDDIGWAQILLAKLRQEFKDVIPAPGAQNIADEILALMEPYKDYQAFAQQLFDSHGPILDGDPRIDFARNILLAHMVREREDPSILLTEIADRIDVFTDLDFVFEKTPSDAYEWLVTRSARAFWTVRYIVRGDLYYMDDDEDLPRAIASKIDTVPQSMVTFHYGLVWHVLENDPRIKSLLANPAINKSQEEFMLDIRTQVGKLRAAAENYQPLLNAARLQYLSLFNGH